MASEIDPPGDEARPWETFLEALRRALCAALKQQLVFADPAEVADLVLNQFQRDERCAEIRRKVLDDRPAHPAMATRHRQDLVDEVREFLLPAACVPDCEAVAEYLTPRCGETRRHALRENLRLRLEPRVQSDVEVLLVRQGIPEPGDAVIERIAFDVLERLFDATRFQRLAASYRPARGVFEPYLLCKAWWLAQEQVELFLKQEPRKASLDDPASQPGDEAGPERPLAERLGDPRAVEPWEILSAPAEAARRRAWAERFERLRAWLEARGASPRHQAILLLYFKAYVEPDIIPVDLRGIVKSGRKELLEDYLRAQASLERLQKELAEAGDALRKTADRLRRHTEALRTRQGISEAALLELECLARRSKIAELEEELDELDPAREQAWADQVQFLLAFKRRFDAQQTYEKRLVELRKYLDHKKPWVRSQKELAALVGLSTGAAGRELAEVRQLIRGAGFGDEFFTNDQEDESDSARDEE